MLHDCGVISVANLDILGNFVELGIIIIKRTIVAHLHKTRESKIRINMVRVITGDLPLEGKAVIMWREMRSIPFIEDGMHKVSVGPKDKVMVVVIVGEIILRTSVVNLTRLLTCPMLWPIHNNRLETT
jgi:hypothetical protein